MDIVSVLENVLARNPEHPGANHHYIHAVEASTTSERALAAAAAGDLSPTAGHLVHMPSHIYILVGDYKAASRCQRDRRQGRQGLHRSTSM